MDGSSPNDVTRVDEPNATVEVDGPPLEHGEQPEAKPKEFELDLGSQFGRYVVVRKLGHGGMGVVYLAYDPKLDRGVALKVLRPGASSADRGDAQERLFREAQAMARLSHPNVLPVYDVGMVESHVFMAMEYVEGQTLGRWLRDAERSWTEVVDVFVGAGRGLAAAHAAGLVHRDFKPDNVMLGEHGRPRVMDFGLARTADDDHQTHPSSAELQSLSDSLSGSGSGPVLSSLSGVSAAGSLTRTGFVLGTPAYMAPEQHFGAAPDPASDQFSFCVALYQALYGERPFVGETSAQLCKATMNGDVRPPPASSRVPGWLRRIVLRGLSSKANERWPSMEALLGQLQSRRNGRGRAGLAGAGVLALVAGAGMWWPRAEAPCQTSESALAEVWHDEARQRLSEAFERTALPFAGSAAERATAGIDAWGQRWIEQHRDACEATEVRREQSERAFDLRMRCLQDRRRSLVALTDVLGSAERRTVEQAVSMVERLPSPSFCADVEALEAEVPPPEDPAERERVEQVRDTLARVHSLLIAARFAEARTSLDEALAAAEGIEYPPLRVELSTQDARLLESEGSFEPAISVLERTLWQAETQGMDRLVVSLASNLLRLEGERDDYARAQMWSALAGAKLDRLGDLPAARAFLEQCRGGMAEGQGDYERAAVHYQASLELREPGTATYAQALGNYGKIHFRAGRLTEAAQTFEQAAEVVVETLGPDHPDAAKLEGNAATAYHAQGDYPRAQKGYESSLERLRRAYGPEHLSVAAGLTNLGGVLYRQGRYDEAIEAGREAIRIKEIHLGAEHPKTGLNLNNVAMAQSKQGDHEAALATFREAERRLVVLGPEHVALVEPRIGQAEELLHLGRPAEAVEAVERAYALERAHGHDPKRRALPAFLLARALWDSGGDRSRAHELIDDGLSVLGDGSGSAEHERLVQSMKTWKAEHPAQ